MSFMAEPQPAGRLLDNLDRVVADPLRFKRKLQIGTRAYALLRARDGLFSLWDSAGAASAGAGVAKSAWVAGTFFAPSGAAGVLAWLGVGAAAATPVGWVVATALVSGGAYYGVMRWIGDGPDRFVDTIPKFINTPIDLLGVQLLDLIGALALRVAAIDGLVDPRERAAIVEHFVVDWGYDAAYVETALTLIAGGIDEPRMVDLARSIAAFQAGNPDCNGAAMQAELMTFLREVIAADGVIDEREELAIEAIERVFAEAHRITLGRIADRLGDGVATVSELGGSAVGATTSAARSVREGLTARWRGRGAPTGG